MDLKFWKKDDDDFDLPDFSDDLSSPDDSAFPDPSQGTPDSQSPDLSSGFSAPARQEPSFSAPVQQPSSEPEQSSGSDVHQQLILARLDAITNKLDVMTNRIERIEQRLENPPKKQSESRGPWYAN